MARTLVVARMPVGGYGPGAALEPVERRRVGEPHVAVGRAAGWNRLQRELLQTLRALCGGRRLESVHVFHEGLSVAGEEALAVAALLAAQGNRAYQLVMDLVERGAKLEQTEDPDLLEREHQLQREALTARRAANRVNALRRYEAQLGEIMAARDAYMASRVNAVIQPGCVGALLVGPEHRVEELVAADVEVCVLPRIRSGSQ